MGILDKLGLQNKNTSDKEDDSPFSIWGAAQHKENRKNIYEEMDRQLREDGMTEDEKKVERLFERL